jgi:hypothetical protein
MTTNTVQLERVTAIRCTHCGADFICNPPDMDLFNRQVDEISLHTARTHGTINVRLELLTESTHDPI